MLHSTIKRITWISCTQEQNAVIPTSRSLAAFTANPYAKVCARHSLFWGKRKKKDLAHTCNWTIIVLPMRRHLKMVSCNPQSYLGCYIHNAVILWILPHRRAHYTQFYSQHNTPCVNMHLLILPVYVKWYRQWIFALHKHPWEVSQCTNLISFRV